MPTDRRIQVVVLTAAGRKEFARMAEAHGWLKPSWYWTGIDAGFELWKGGEGLRVTNFTVNS